MTVDMLVEGPTDEVVARKVIQFCGHTPGIVYGKKGWHYIREKLDGFGIRAFYGNPILVLIDFMDSGLTCPPEIRKWVRSPHPRFLVRAVVREIESWILADQQGVAKFLGISPTVIPREPEKLENPKQTLVNLARRSRRRKLRNDMIPSPGTSGIVGPGYVTRIQEMIYGYWNVQVAAESSISLKRCIERLRLLE